jgi:hypothetical protein
MLLCFTFHRLIQQPPIFFERYVSSGDIAFNRPYNDLTRVQSPNVILPYCMMHTSKPLSDKGWAEQEMTSLPNVKISLKLLESCVQQLLASHNGILPLPRYFFINVKFCIHCNRIMILI